MENAKLPINVTWGLPMQLLKWADQGVERMCTAISTMRDEESYAVAANEVQTSRLGQLDQENRSASHGSHAIFLVFSICF